MRAHRTWTSRAAPFCLLDLSTAFLISDNSIVMLSGTNSGTALQLPQEAEGPYRFVERSQEVNLIRQRIHLGLQLHFVHVGSIHILKE